MKSGFIVIDKPLNMTSHDVVYQMRKKLNIKKIGHTGTLDPQASGVLVCAINKGLKFIEYIIEDTKKLYIADICFGSISSTYDSEGDITLKEIDKYPLIEEVEQGLKNNFLGEIEQIPPIHSRVKIKGIRAYDYARKNKEVEMPSRKVKVYNYNIIDYKPPYLKVEIEVSKGFYVRSLANDLGKILKCGGYLAGLKRTKVGLFKIEQAIKIEEISSDKIIDLNIIRPLFNIRELNNTEYYDIINGRRIKNIEKIKNNKKYIAVKDNNIISILKK